MTIEQLEKLLDAGFSKDEIISIVKDEPAAPAAPVVQASEESTQEQTEPEHVEKTIVAESKPEYGELSKRLDGIEHSISEMIKTFHTTNLRNDSFGSMPDSIEDQTDKIMAAIIRPESGKE